MPTPTPAHRLGPHVVGERVVIRRIVPEETGPTGGPAFTDVLGLCTAWGPSVAVVESATGPVEIPLALIVSGKPVPPRPSVRLRVSAHEAELHSAALFPAVSAVPLGPWSLRWEPRPVGRLRKRANSCLAMCDPQRPAGEALDAVRDFYAARDRQTLIQVEQDSDIEHAARAAGWTAVPGDSAFLLVSVAQLRRRLPTPDLPVTVTAAHGLVDTGVAVGRAGWDGDWVGLHDIAVDPAHRRQGLARRVMAALVDAAAERGATTAWLHVETDNAPAMALYSSLGFAEHHRARYLTYDA